jgi:hypothetical protein
MLGSERNAMWATLSKQQKRHFVAYKDTDYHSAAIQWFTSTVAHDRGMMIF